MKTITCPDCEGEGGFSVLDESNILTDFRPCATCNGEGTIPHPCEEQDNTPHGAPDEFDDSKQEDIDNDLGRDIEW